jgi:hypothetical protein
VLALTGAIGLLMDCGDRHEPDFALVKFSYGGRLLQDRQPVGARSAAPVALREAQISEIVALYRAQYAARLPARQPRFAEGARLDRRRLGKIRLRCPAALI